MGRTRRRLENKKLWVYNVSMVQLIERGEYVIRTPREFIDWQIGEIEHAGRICYRSESGQITLESAAKFIDMIERRGHESVTEHSYVSVEFWNISRGVTHELVRHRLAAYSQESTRYVDYTGNEVNLRGFEMSAVLPKHRDWNENILLEDGTEMTPIEMMGQIEKMYRGLRQSGWKPEDARQILPIGLGTRIEMTANFREWRHVFSLRTTKPAHWEIRDVMGRLLEDMKEVAKPVFIDFVKEGEDGNDVPYYEMIDRRSLVDGSN